MWHEKSSGIMEKMIETVGDIVAALGGTGKTASLLGVGGSAVSNWLREGEIPRAHHLPLYLALNMRGLRVNLDVFQIPERILGPRDAPQIDMREQHAS